MKSYIAIFVLLLVAAVAYADHHEHHHTDYVVKTHEDLIKYRTECVEKLHVTDELVEKYKKWDFPDDEKTHCYMKCIFKKFGLFDGEHGFNVDKIHQQLVGTDGTADHHDEMHKKIEKCAISKPEGADACTWAYRGGMCFIGENMRLVKESVKA